MKTSTAALAAVGVVVAILGWATIRDIVDGPEPPDPAPTPGPGMPAGVELVQVPRGGQLYDCVVYYHGGIFCWDTPAGAAAPSTPPELP